MYSTTGPIPQTKSNTQRPLMYLDEVLHMNNRECLVLLRGQNVLKLYKITPEEFPAFCRLKDVRVSSHTPRWAHHGGIGTAARSTAGTEACAGG